MRRKLNKGFKSYLIEFAKDKTIDELLPLVNEKFNETYNRKKLQVYLIKNKIPYKYSYPSKVRDMSAITPIGAEREREGRTFIKVGKNKWEDKQRYIYEQYHKVKLTPNDFIIFLDGDKTNFNIDNLYKVTRYEASHLGNIYSHSKDKDLRRLSVNIAKLMIKTKEKRKEYE